MYCICTHWSSWVLSTMRSLSCIYRIKHCQPKKLVVLIKRMRSNIPHISKMKLQIRTRSFLKKSSYGMYQFLNPHELIQKIVFIRVESTNIPVHRFPYVPSNSDLMGMFNRNSAHTSHGPLGFGVRMYTWDVLMISRKLAITFI